MQDPVENRDALLPRRGRILGPRYIECALVERTDCLYVIPAKHRKDPHAPHRTIPRPRAYRRPHRGPGPARHRPAGRLRGQRAQAHRRGGQRAVLRRRARLRGRPGALVADPVAGPRAAGSLGTGARGRADHDHPGGDRPRPGFRPVRGRRPRYPRPGRPDRAPRGRRPVPVRAQPDVPGGGGRHHRAGAGPRAARAAGLRRRCLGLPSPRSSAGTRSRRWPASSASSISPTGAPSRPGGRASVPGIRTSRTRRRAFPRKRPRPPCPCTNRTIPGCTRLHSARGLPGRENQSVNRRDGPG